MLLVGLNQLSNSLIPNNTIDNIISFILCIVFLTKIKYLKCVS